MKGKKNLKKIKTQEVPRGDLQTFKVRCSLEHAFYLLVEAHDSEEAERVAEGRDRGQLLAVGGVVPALDVRGGGDMTVGDMLSELDHEVWARVEPETRKTGLMVWSADWHCNAYLPRGLDKYRNWEVADVYVEVGKDPETGEQAAILVIPAIKPERR